MLAFILPFERVFMFVVLPTLGGEMLVILDDMVGLALVSELVV